MICIILFRNRKQGWVERSINISTHPQGVFDWNTEVITQQGKTEILKGWD